MKQPIIRTLTFLIISLHQPVFGQTAYRDSTRTKTQLKFNYKALIIPSVMIGYGFVGMESDGIKIWNSEIKEELRENIDEKATIDDFSQHIPALSVYALNTFGVKGKHNIRDRTIILATSYLMMSAVITGLKQTAGIKRPDESSYNSFPSGHTATAFMGAEFLWQEYKDVSPWYGLTGYAIAAGTGFFRMYNERHWMTDVAAGAGIGILSTKAAYWLYPYINDKIFRGNRLKNTASMIYPFYNHEQLGMTLSLRF
ncbi:phosphatase PAP2 family protein [Geofilum sp. OHC36d9]|uniref:phosphatase PAP2 family protein n=1 Tax=Geofilum sp. OHC36d9 TaxID=3458413 RepID=UPI0040335CB1